MKNFLKALLFLFLIVTPAFALYGHFDEFDKTEEELHKDLIIPKGSFFRCFLGQAISSEFNNSGDSIKILVPSDFTLENRVLIPKNSTFIGVVKNLSQAQRGMDGYFSIDIVGLVFPDGRQFNAQGYVSFGKNSRVLGGAFTRRIGHKNTLHRASPNGKYGILYLQQDGARIMGKETRLQMGELVNVVLEEEINVEN